MSLQSADAAHRSNEATASVLRESHKRSREERPSPVSRALERLLRLVGIPASTVNRGGMLERNQEQELAPWLAIFDLCYMVDKGHDLRLRSSLVVTCQARHDAGPEEAIFPAQARDEKIRGKGTSLTPQLASLIAEELAVCPRDVVEMECRLAGDLSLNVPASSEGGQEWQDLLIDHSLSPEALVAEYDENTQKADALHAALNVLTERERRVFVARRLSEHPPELEQLGRELSVSGERVRQIEISAFEKVKRAARRNLWCQREPR
jgi:Sigma-70, region 4